MVGKSVIVPHTEHALVSCRADHNLCNYHAAWASDPISYTIHGAGEWAHDLECGGQLFGQWRAHTMKLKVY